MYTVVIFQGSKNYKFTTDDFNTALQIMRDENTDCATIWRNSTEPVVEPGDKLPAQPSEDAERVLFQSQYMLYPAWLLEENDATGRAKIMFWHDIHGETWIGWVDSWRVMKQQKIEAA